ncbi:hypothetical protein [Sporomusa malonica]|uniref:DUF1269 domain-containing protein n=1 Tax=Sporomusa malonica TaxID=112901 RepID=A0A1W2EZT2_9FIRM|nr:hypothetical protein [Sporomusa malonica]SMD14716.1 hypothetical protein SAMN04488500_1358 [Sporomusa malonica]
MYIFASFEQSALLEIAISDLTRLGLTEKHILAVPLQKTTRQVTVFDKVYRADGFSVLDGAALLGTVGMLLGVVYGSVYYLGPIICGLLGLLSGAVIGLAVDWVITTRNIKSEERSNPIPVMLMVRCEVAQAEAVEKILEEHQALGLARHSNEALTPSPNVKDLGKQK